MTSIPELAADVAAGVLYQALLTQQEEVRVLRERVRQLEIELGINPERNAEIAAVGGKPVSALKAAARKAAEEEARQALKERP